MCIGAFVRTYATYLFIPFDYHTTKAIHVRIDGSFCTVVKQLRHNPCVARPVHYMVYQCAHTAAYMVYKCAHTATYIVYQCAHTAAHQVQSTKAANSSIIAATIPGQTPAMQAMTSDTIASTASTVKNRP